MTKMILTSGLWGTPGGGGFLYAEERDRVVSHMLLWAIFFSTPSTQVFDIKAIFPDPRTLGARLGTSVRGLVYTVAEGRGIGPHGSRRRPIYSMTLV